MVVSKRLHSPAQALTRVLGTEPARPRIRPNTEGASSTVSVDTRLDATTLVT